MSAARRPRLLHVATGLDVGGAQVMLTRLAPALERAGFAQEVVALTAGGPLAETIRQLGIRTHAVGLDRSRPNPVRLARVVRLVRSAAPDVVQTWMYHADLIGGVAARLSSRARIVWGIHNSTVDARTTRRTTRWCIAACARLSRRVPDRIVCVSRAARALHQAEGYAADRFVVIPNGVDVAAFQPDAAARRQVRAELGVADDAVLIGLVARVDPQKDHATFLAAAALLAERRPAVRFVLCGEGASTRDAALCERIRARGQLSRFHLLGARADVARVMNALDVGTLSSAYGEALPLAIAEAMSCGVPCVVTDVGDCALLVGDTGVAVPPRDPVALAAAWDALVARGRDGRRELGLRARRRVEAEFGLERTARAYATLYRGLLDG